jgi:CXXX repeat modification system protein
MAQQKVVGKVSDEEVQEIKSLFYKKAALEALFKTLVTTQEANTSSIYEKMMSDYQEVNMKFQEWWTAAASKYQWEGVEGSSWNVNFDNGEIYLVV